MPSLLSGPNPISVCVWNSTSVPYCLVKPQPFLVKTWASFGSTSVVGQNHHHAHSKVTLECCLKLHCENMLKSPTGVDISSINHAYVICKPAWLTIGHHRVWLLPSGYLTQRTGTAPFSKRVYKSSCLSCCFMGHGMASTANCCKWTEGNNHRMFHLFSQLWLCPL
jgi:hypothetical protein